MAKLIHSRFFSESYGVCYRAKRESTLLDDKKTPFKALKNPIKGWVADPFLIEYEGTTYVFVENYGYLSHRGTIAYAKITENGPSRWKTVIREKYHMSYPYLVKYGDDVYMIPETSEIGELCVYKAVSFPNKWEKMKVLRDCEKIADTTFFEYQQKLYALTYDVADLQNPKWKLLDVNDSKNDRVLPNDDIDKKRPAGCFFKIGEQTYRPAQNCEKMYGEALVFYKCNAEGMDYSEELIQEVRPEDIFVDQRIKGIKGLHTYNFTENYEVIDIQYRRFTLVALFARLVDRVKKLFKRK